MHALKFKRMKEMQKQTRIVLLGTSIPIFISDREPDFSLPLLSDFLIDEGIWTPNTEPPKWHLIYHQDHPRKESWIFREFMRNQGTWVGWTLSRGGAWKAYRVFPEKLWDEILEDLRAAKDPLDESIGDKLRTKREAFPEDEISGYQEASMSADYYDRVKSIREQTKPPSDG